MTLHSQPRGLLQYYIIEIANDDSWRNRGCRRTIDLPSFWGDLFKSPGWSDSVSLISSTTPDTGAYISEAALTDSTAPIESVHPIFPYVSFSGSPHNNRGDIRAGKSLYMNI